MNRYGEESRKTELHYLEKILDDEGPDVIGVHGIAGVGKSTLVQWFSERHPDRCRLLDCRSVEPTPRAFMEKLNAILSSNCNQLSDYQKSISPGTVLILDNFESFCLLESWLRTEFVPAILGKLKLILSGRLVPDNQWVINPPKNCNFARLHLECLSFTTAVAFLQSQGLSKVEAIRVNQFAKGHPVALKLAGVAMLEQPDRELHQVPPNSVIRSLVQFFIEDIKSDDLRDALEASSVVRRVSDSLLSAMLQIDNKSAVQLYGELEKMEFIESHDDGLSLHEMIRTVLSSSLKARSPLKYSCYRRNAGKTLLEEMKEVSCNQLWRYTADILYLVDNPVIRSAFFPQNDQRTYSVLPAQPADRQTVLSSVCEHESAVVSDIYSMWWDRNPGSFHCVKDSDNKVAGFYFLLKPEQVTKELRKQDPVISEWMNDLALRDGGHLQADKNLFIRRWLSVADGENLSTVQAACWLDIKRTYLEMRPRLQRVYLTLNDLQPYASAATELGFQVLGKVIEIDKMKYYTAMLDMGPDSVDGWISTRLMNEIAQDSEHEEHPDWFDPKARQLKLNQQRIDLTPLEFGTLDLLVKNSGTAITRKQLLKEVWGIEYEGASNVVDTIVLSLRKKLQQKSAVIHSVRGTGYRFESDK